MQATNAITTTRSQQPSAAKQFRGSIATVPHIDASDTKQIRETFKKKVPFIIENAQQNPHGVDMAYLENNLADLKVTCFNPESKSEHTTLGPLLQRIKAGEKYRLRADVFIGRKLGALFQAGYFQKIRNYAFTLMDMILHFFARKKWAVFLSTPSCKMSNHAHINSVFVVQLEGRKTWHLDFRGLDDIEHKDLYPYDFLAEKHPADELEITLEPGQVLYLPAYWFHYTDTDEVTLSMHYLFAEPMSYYFRRAVRPLFFYELFRRPLGMMKLALSRNNEIGFGDKALWEKTKTKNELEFLAQNDYS